METRLLNDKPILIVEDNIFLALDLSSAVEDLQGRVVGPAASATEALELLARDDIAAAVIDCEIIDATVVMYLAEKRIPMVMHTAAGVQPEMANILPEVPVLREPVQPKDLINRLITEIARAAD